MNNASRRVPVPVALLFAMDIALVAAPVIDYWSGSPFGRLRHLIDLDAENTLPTWYSSMQWFCAAFLFALLTIHAYRSRLRGLTAAAALALACCAFSIDEIAGIHEWLGHKSDALLPGGSRAATGLWSTGLWPFLLGIPVLLMLTVVVIRIRDIFVARSPRALQLLVVGLVIMFTGALGVELAANLVGTGSGNGGLVLSQLVLEEFMEMLGVSFIVWSAYDVLLAYGFELKMPVPTPRLEAGTIAVTSPVHESQPT